MKVNQHVIASRQTNNDLCQRLHASLLIHKHNFLNESQSLNDVFIRFHKSVTINYGKLVQ